MKYKEQLQQEIAQAQLQLQELEQLEQKKMKQLWEIPNEAPVYDKPSIDLNDIPMMPPAPILDKPEWQGGTVPFDAPKYEKPEWHGGVVPFDAPVLDKPELHIPVDPEKPSEPNKPNSDKPKPQPKQDTPHEINSNPSSKPVEPQKEQVNVIYQPQETNAHTLPNTGSESTLILSFAGMFILGGMARIALKREGE